MKLYNNDIKGFRVVHAFTASTKPCRADISDNYSLVFIIICEILLVNKKRLTKKKSFSVIFLIKLTFNKICLSLSLSLYIYIYIYIYTHTHTHTLVSACTYVYVRLHMRIVLMPEDRASVKLTVLEHSCFEWVLNWFLPDK